MGAVVDELSELIVQMLLYELDLDDLVAQEALENFVRFLFQLIEQLTGIVAEPTGDQLGRSGRAAVRRRRDRRDDDQDAVFRQPPAVSKGDIVAGTPVNTLVTGRDRAGE